MRKALQLLISAGALLALSSCGDATGILVEVTSPDLSVPANIDGLRFSVTTTSGRTLERSYPIVGGWPQSLTVLPATNSEGEVTITVTGLLADAPVVSQTVRTTFIPGMTRTERVVLTSDCVGVMCGAGQECVGGMCVDLPTDAGVDAGADGGGVDGGGDDGGLDAGSDGGGVDAGGTDGGSDAGFDSGVDAGPPAPRVLFFSQYVEGASSNKALEIVNGGTGTASLVGCQVRRYANGGTSGTPITLSGSLVRDDVLVICNGGIDASAMCDMTTATISHNGDDAFDLHCDGVVLDTFGRIGEDPGVEWTGGGLSTLDYVLTRRCSITAGDTVGGDAFDPSVEWTGAAWVSPAVSLVGLGNRSECP